MGFGVCSHTRDHVQTFGGGGITCDQATWAPSRSTPARTCPTGQRIICNDGSFNQRATLDLHNSAQILICLITIILIYRYCNIYIYISFLCCISKVPPHPPHSEAIQNHRNPVAVGCGFSRETPRHEDQAKPGSYRSNLEPQVSLRKFCHGNTSSRLTTAKLIRLNSYKN